MCQQSSAFTESLIRFLMPYFVVTAVDINAARADIVETLNSYGARTRPDMLNAARIIAFSMASCRDDENAEREGRWKQSVGRSHGPGLIAFNAGPAGTKKPKNQTLAVIAITG